MAYAIKSGSRFKTIPLHVDAPYTALPLTFDVEYCGEVTAIGPAQNGDRCRTVSVTVLATDTWAQVAAKIKAAVDADVARG